MFKQFYLALFFFLSLNVNADIMGGEIIWECRPSGKYRFTLVVYRDCGGATLPTSTQTLGTNCGTSISCSYITTVDVVPSCYTGTTSCSGATSGSGKMQKYIYRSGDIQLTGTPPASGWYFTWSRCCRPTSISNISSLSSASYMLRAIMYPYTPPGSTSALTATTGGNPTCFDSSPNFLEDPQVISCTGVDVVYNNLGYDPDLDSLFYDWSYPWDATTFSANPSSNSVNFSSGYSYNSPMPSTGSSTGADIDNETGEVTFNSAVAGSWATCVKIEEWRCGQLIGEVYRDIPIVTLSCTPPTGLCSAAFVDEEPEMSLTIDSSLANPTILTPVTNLAGDTIYYYTEVYPGDTVRFKISSADPYPNPNCSSQNIQFKASGGNLSSAANYSNPNNCLFNPPCATLSSLNPGNVFTYPGINNVQFNWYIDCNHLFYQQYQCGNLKSEYSFYLRMQDDQCPINRFDYKKVVVKVKNYMPELPSLDSTCISYNGAGVTFDWVANPDTGFNFDYYLINYIDSNGNQSVLDTITDWSTQSYTHSNVSPTAIHSYFIQVAGGCDLLSNSTDTIQNVRVGLQSFNSSIAVLSWNTWLRGDTNTTYDVWVEAPIGSGSWSQIGSTSDFTFTDSVTFCGDWLSYQVRYHTTCESASDSGFFSDISPPSPVVVDSITVTQGNLAALSWEATTDSDVVYFRIYKKDSLGFFQPVDSLAKANYTTSMPWIYTLSNADKESEIFMVNSVDNCGNESPSNSVETLHLNVEPTDSTFELTWNNQVNDQGTVFYSIFWQEYNGSTPGNYGLIANQLDTSIVIPRDVDFENYCGYIQSKSSASQYYSESNRVCLSYVDIEENNIEFSIRPNPSNGSFTIDLNENLNHYYMEIFDVLGQLVYEGNLSNGANLIRLPKHVRPGSYLIKVSSDSVTTIRSIIVN